MIPKKAIDETTEETADNRPQLVILDDQDPKFSGKVADVWRDRTISRKEYIEKLAADFSDAEGENHLPGFDWGMLDPKLDMEPEPPPPSPDPEVLLHTFKEGDIVVFEPSDKSFIQYNDTGENIGVVTYDNHAEELVYVDWEYSENNNPPPSTIPRWFLEKSSDPAALVKLFNKKLEKRTIQLHEGDPVRSKNHPGSVGTVSRVDGTWVEVDWHPDSQTCPPSYIEKNQLEHAPYGENQLKLSADLQNLNSEKNRIDETLRRQQDEYQYLRIENNDLRHHVEQISEEKTHLRDELTATRNFTESLADRLERAMREIQDLKNAGKHEEVEEIENQEVLPVLSKMRKRDIAKSFIKTVGKTVGKEVLVRIAQMSGYDMNWLIKLIVGG